MEAYVLFLFSFSYNLTPFFLLADYGFTYDGDTQVAKVYVDGVLRSTFEGRPEIDFADQEGLMMAFGHYAMGYSSSLNTVNRVYSSKAAFDEVRVYNRVLSDAQMATLGSPATAFGSTAQTRADDTLILHYTFDKT